MEMYLIEAEIQFYRVLYPHPTAQTYNFINQIYKAI